MKTTAANSNKQSVVQTTASLEHCQKFFLFVFFRVFPSKICLPGAVNSASIFVSINISFIFYFIEVIPKNFIVIHKSVNQLVYRDCYTRDQVPFF